MVTLYGSGTILLTKSVHRHYEGCTTKQVQHGKNYLFLRIGY